MSKVDRKSIPRVPTDLDTPQVRERGRGMPAAWRVAAKEETDGPEEEEIYEDAWDAGEVFIRRDFHPQPPPMIENPAPHPLFLRVSIPHMKPEDYDGTTEWLEYKVYFNQLAELYGWDEERKAMVLGICLKGEARVVLASLNQAQRRSYLAVTTALAQSFSPKELVYLYQAELKARKKKPEATMANLRWDIAKLVQQAYPTADMATCEVIGINAFPEALPGPASEMKLYVIKGRPRALQEAMAHATEVDVVVETENKKAHHCKRDCWMVGAAEEHLAQEVRKLHEDLAKTIDELKNAQRRPRKFNGDKKPTRDDGCYNCGEKGNRYYASILIDYYSQDARCRLHYADCRPIKLTGLCCAIQCNVFSCLNHNVMLLEIIIDHNLLQVTLFWVRPLL